MDAARPGKETVGMPRLHSGENARSHQHEQPENAVIISAEELAWALDTHVDYAQAVLDRIKAKQRREPNIPPLPIDELIARLNRHQEGGK